MNTKKDTSSILLNKFISSSGFCSRRQAVDYIKSGKVTVNGAVVKTPYTKVTAKDKVLVKNKLITFEEKIYILLNKPKDCVTTVSDERDRKTVINLVKHVTKKRVYPVGRLDRGTTGLLLLTNDGELTQKLSHPKYEVTKIYIVVLDKPLKVEDLQKIKAGLKLKDGLTRIDRINFVPSSKKNKVKVQLHSGKNRIIRRLFKHVDYHVIKLDRINYAGLTKRGLPVGRSRLLTKKEIADLQKYGSVQGEQKNKRLNDAKRFTKRKSKKNKTKKTGR